MVEHIPLSHIITATICDFAEIHQPKRCALRKVPHLNHICKKLPIYVHIYSLYRPTLARFCNLHSVMPKLWFTMDILWVRTAHHNLIHTNPHGNGKKWEQSTTTSPFTSAFVSSNTSSPHQQFYFIQKAARGHRRNFKPTVLSREPKPEPESGRPISLRDLSAFM